MHVTPCHVTSHLPSMQVKIPTIITTIPKPWTTSIHPSSKKRLNTKPNTPTNNSPTTESQTRD